MTNVLSLSLRSLLRKKKKEMTAMSSYANSDALSHTHTSSVVKEKETRREETSMRSKRIRNKKAIYVLRTPSSCCSFLPLSLSLSCFLYIHVLYSEYVWYLFWLETYEEKKSTDLFCCDERREQKIHYK